VSDPIAYALSNPREALDELRKLRCERSLHAFVLEMWPELEPETELVDGWPLEAICAVLEAVERGDIRKLLINVPPGFMKSMLVSVFFPAWLWGPRNRAGKRVISTSYAQDLAVRDNARCRDLMQSERYRKWWGDRVVFKDDQNAKLRYENKANGFRQASSTGAALTGHRGDILIIDDPHSVKSAESDAERHGARMWVGETVPTRFNNQKLGVTIVIMQRLHQGDVSGFILGEQEDEEPLPGYVHLMIPMRFERDRKCVIDIPGFHWEDPREVEGELAWPDRFDEEAVSDLEATFRRAGGEYAVSGQLQQNPIPREGGMFQRQDFQIIDRAPEGLFHQCRGWDFAATKDGHGARTAGIKLALKGGKVYILDAVFGRWGPNEVVTNVKALVNQDGFNVMQSYPQDPGQAGKAQRSYLAGELMGANIHFSPESGSKEDRARPLSAQAESGNLYVVRAPWNDALINEFTNFPGAELKDIVDGASRAFHWLVANQPPDLGAAPEML
jgi:predicted phage terminase large subunit-like protein